MKKTLKICINYNKMNVPLLFIGINKISSNQSSTNNSIIYRY